jgi:sulfite exporter TauE/SafE
MDNISIISIITVAFLGSFGHCLGMCGGIVIAYSSTKIDPKWHKLYQGLAHLTYSLGRITTYMTIGAVFGAIGGAVSFSGHAIAALTILAGVFMILAGLSISGKLQFLTLLEHSFSRSGWYQKAFRSVLQSQSLYSFYLLGLLNGLLPCGLVYFFAVTAASTGSAFWGAFVMLIFGLSTVPAMMGLGFFTSIFTHATLRKTMMNLAAIVVVLFGLYTIYRGYDFIRHPDKSLLNCCDTSVDTLDTNLSVPKFKPALKE